MSQPRHDHVPTMIRVTISTAISALFVLFITPRWFCLCGAQATAPELALKADPQAINTLDGRPQIINCTFRNKATPSSHSLHSIDLLKNRKLLANVTIDHPNLPNTFAGIAGDVKGQLKPSDLDSYSYLSMTIQSPTTEDKGVYSCKVHIVPVGKKSSYYFFAKIHLQDKSLNFIMTGLRALKNDNSVLRQKLDALEYVDSILENKTKALDNVDSILLNKTNTLSNVESILLNKTIALDIVYNGFLDKFYALEYFDIALSNRTKALENAKNIIFQNITAFDNINHVFLETFNAVKNAFNSLEEKVTGFENAKHVLARTIKKLSMADNASLKKIKVLENAENVTSQKLDLLKTSDTNMSRRLENLEDDYSQVSEKVNRIESGENKNSNQIQALETADKNFSGKIDNLKDFDSTILTKLHVIEHSENLSSKRIQQLENTGQNISQKMTSFENELSKFTQSTTALNNTDSLLYKQLQGIKDNVSKLDITLDEFKSIQSILVRMKTSKYNRGHAYFYSDVAVNAKTAEKACHCLGGYLVEIGDKQEWTFVTDFLKDATQTSALILVGGSDDKKEGTWYWKHSNKPMTYVDWYRGEPTNFYKEDCLCLSRIYDFRFNDVICFFTIYHFVCEKEF